ncbi:MAG: SdpI family protein [Actinobacteria bacterium]|nr:SdpI family protein [Actinomycetota bacterium]
MDDAVVGGLIGGGAMLFSGLLIMWMGNRMAERRIKPNRWAGIRTPSTVKSDEAWYAAHDAGAASMSASGTLGATGGLTGIIAALLGASEGVVVGLILGGTLLMTVLLIVATVRGTRAAREVGVG